MTDHTTESKSATDAKPTDLPERLRRIFYHGPGLPSMYFALGALFFGVGIIAMANVLLPEDMGVVALFLVLLRLGSALGPVGLEVLLIRARPERDEIPFLQVTASSLAAAFLIVVVAAAAYEFSVAHSAALALGLVSATFWRMFIALDQARQRSRQALTLSQLPNVIALILGMLAVFGDVRSPLSLCFAASTGYLLAALLGWRLSHAVNWHDDYAGKVNWPFADRISLAALAAVTSLLAGIERFLIPRVLNFEELALYAAVASLAVAPLKLLTAAAKFYLVPLVVAADSSRKLLDVVYHQGAALAGMAVVSCVAVLAISPWLWPRILPASYDIDGALVLAVLVLGGVRLYVGIVTTVLRGAGDSRSLWALNASAWVCLGLCAVCTAVLSNGELVTFVWIVAGGIAFYGITATALINGSINRSEAYGVTKP